MRLQLPEPTLVELVLLLVLLFLVAPSAVLPAAPVDEAPHSQGQGSKARQGSLPAGQSKQPSRGPSGSPNDVRGTSAR